MPIVHITLLLVKDESDCNFCSSILGERFHPIFRDALHRWDASIVGKRSIRKNQLRKTLDTDNNYRTFESVLN